MSDLFSESHIIDNVRVDVRVWEGRKPLIGTQGFGATVDVTCLPGYAHWVCPDSRTLRRIVDKALKGTGLVRNGERRNGDAFPGWRFFYTLTESE